LIGLGASSKHQPCHYGKASNSAAFGATGANSPVAIVKSAYNSGAKTGNARIPVTIDPVILL
jgi:hypothetical protein